ncbi:porin [Thioalkalivibrio sulfidiphilus]|uniref:porin n=1 Tax=Thioalkalivibrio sulfidiphilus TaxID=1033854 RepID=UPI003B3261C1
MMKKTLIAAGVAAAMAIPAIAAADVQLSANLQAEIVNLSGDAAGGNGKGWYMGDGMEYGNFNSGNWSRVDLRASHDLGNGLTAFGHIAANPNISTGAALTGSREVLVGLRGGFGSVSAGRMTTAYATAGKDPFNATFMQARGNGGMLGGIGGLGNGSYFNNAIGYAGKFEMVSLAATFAIDQSANVDATSDDNNGQHAYAVRVNVDLSPVEIWVAHTNGDEYGQNALTNNFGCIAGVGPCDFQATKVGAEFKTGAFTVMAQYEDVTHEVSGGAFAGEKGLLDGSHIMAAGTYRMGANTFMLGYGQFDGFESFEGSWLALGARHAFNRNVSVHGGVRQTEYKFEGEKKKETAVGAGMRVTF